MNKYQRNSIHDINFIGHISQYTIYQIVVYVGLENIILIHNILCKLITIDHL